jgi:hypothetical protein
MNILLSEESCPKGAVESMNCVNVNEVVTPSRNIIVCLVLFLLVIELLEGFVFENKRSVCFTFAVVDLILDLRHPSTSVNGFHFLDFYKNILVYFIKWKVVLLMVITPVETHLHSLIMVARPSMISTVFKFSSCQDVDCNAANIFSPMSQMEQLDALEWLRFAL